ncbi:hypothetical protein [uncultured Muriicola sp.]|uniref:hypothetical protein n=1 Tax=uncultured Muriicola sp. TaxID=1583102 RepID=UPI00260C37CC|nr:hypothetical protein [uncultured Muriicola sp.]
MENQNCKVGATTHITSGSHASDRVESFYNSFATMASDTQYVGTQMGEFFDRKARSLKKILEELV